MRSGQLYAPLILLGGVIAMVRHGARPPHPRLLPQLRGRRTTAATRPLLYSITGLWSALAGSILLWGVVLGGYATAMVWRFRRRSGDDLVAWATLVVYVVAAFFFGLMLGPADPFQHVAGAVPANGPGPNSLLQDNPLVLIHPPMLYLGLVGFTLPFAFAIASLITGRLDEDWQGETRRWTLFAWAFLTMGILLGAWWSYQVLGWGGFWGWDPVENAALLPWLVGTAYLHSVMVQQRRGLLRIWNLSLVVAAFSLTILGTFLTRSGVVQSVHSFSDSTIGPLLLGFFGLVVVTGVGLIAWRGDRLHSAGGIDSPVSREGAFLANNLLFVGFAFVVLLGTVFPLLYEALNPSSSVAVGAPYFNRFFIPVGLALLFLMAVAPALPWRKTTVEVMRGRLAVPAAFGVVVVVACVLGGIHGVEPLLAFGLGAFAAGIGRPGPRPVGPRRLPRGPLGRASPARAAAGRVAGFRRPGQRGHGRPHRRGGHRRRPGRRHLVPPPRRAAPVEGAVGHVRRAHRRPSSAPVRSPRRPTRHSRPCSGSTPGATFYPAISQFGSGTQAVGTPAIDSSWRNDLYLTIDTIPTTGTAWTFGVVEQPLVMWLWIGALLVGFGSVLSAIPGRRRRPTDPVSAPVVARTAPIHDGPEGRGRRRNRSPTRRPRPTRCRSAPETSG